MAAPPPPLYKPFYDPRKGAFPNIQSIIERHWSEPHNPLSVDWEGVESYQKAYERPLLSDTVGGLLAGFGPTQEIGEQLLGGTEQQRREARARLEKRKQRNQKLKDAVGMLPFVGDAVGTVLDLAGLPGELTEQTLGQIQQKGLPDTARSMSAGFKMGLAEQFPVLRAKGHSSEALAMSAAIVRAQMEGKDTAELERALAVLEPDPRSRETYLQAAGKDADHIIAWDVSAWYYENIKYVNEARARLKAGESWESVSASIESKITAGERIRDFVGQVVLDPLNVIDIAAGVTRKVAKASKIRTTRFVVSATSHADEVVDTLKVVKDISKPAWWEHIPLLARTDEARAARVAQEGYDIVAHVNASVSPHAIENLRDIGVVGVSPRQLAMELLLGKTDDLAGTGKSADEIAQALGLAARPAASKEIGRLGLTKGAIIDPVNSEAAIRFRVSASEMPRGIDDLGKQWDEVHALWDEALKGTGGLKGPKALDVHYGRFEKAENALLDFIKGIENGARKAVGLDESPGLMTAFRKSRGVKAMQEIQGAFAVYAHMGLSPAWAIRNYLNNTTTLALDGVMNWSPLRNTTDFLAENQVLTSAFARQAGMGIDAMKAKGPNPLRRWAGRGPLRFSKAFERESSLRAIATGFKKTMKKFWRADNFLNDIDADLMKRVEAAFGGIKSEEAQRVVRQIEQAWTPEKLALVLPNLQGETWRLLDDSKVINRLRDANIYDDVALILRTSSTKEEALMRLQDLVDKSRGFADDTYKVMQPPKGSAAARLLDEERALEEAMGASEADVIKNTEQFLTKLADERRAVNEAEAYAQEAIRSIPDNAAGRKMLDKFAGQLQKANEEYAELFPKLEAELRTLYTYDLDAIRKMDSYESATSLHEAFANYRMRRDELWTNARKGVFENFIELADEAARAGGKTSARRPAYDVIATWGTKGQKQRLYALNRMASERGMHPQHMTNWLKKNSALGIPKDRRLLTATDVVDDDWYRMAVETMEMRKLKKEMSAAAWKALDYDKLFGSRPAHLTVADTAYNLDKVRTANATAIDAAVQEAAEHIGKRASKAATALSDEQADVLRELLDELHPRLSVARRSATDVGQVLRDATLFNYADRRNIDTFLGLGFSYPFWYTRNMAGFLKRAIYQPGVVASLIKARQAIRRMNAGLPEWWQDQIPLTLGDTTFYLPILNAVDPLNGLLGDKFVDPDRTVAGGSTVYAEFLNTLSNYGPGLHSAISLYMMADAFSRDRPDEATSWMSYLGQPSRAFNALTVGLKWAGMDFIPAGGYSVESWLWQDGPFSGAMSKWEARRVGYEMYEMARSGQYTKEELLEAAKDPDSELYQLAVQQSKERTAAWVLLSWGAGVGFKPRKEFEIEIAQMDIARADLFRRKPGGKAADEMSPEEYRLAWQEFRKKYPFSDFVVMFRKDPAERDEIYAWSVFNRLPPNGNAYFEALGYKPEVFGEMLNKFYDNQLGGMSELERESFMAAMHQLGAILSLPDNATVDEWNSARNARRAMWNALEREFGSLDDMRALEDRYFRIRDGESPGAAREYLEANPKLEMFWKKKSEIVLADPFLKRYYSSMELFEKSLKSQFYDDIYTKLPGVEMEIDTYYSLRDSDLDAARQYLDNHPQIKQYWLARDEFELGLRERLEQMASAVEALEPRFAALQGNAQITHPGQQSVANLIEAGARPMGEFELPENMSDRELKAAISVELASIPAGQYNNVKRALRLMGDLDDVLDAFQEFRNLGTVAANTIELKTLLVALNTIRDGKNWPLATSDAYQPSVISQWRGASGAAEKGAWPTRRVGGEGRIRSSTHGGGGKKPLNKKQRGRQDERIRSFLADLKHKNPYYWSLLRNMAGMTTEQKRELLKNNPLFTSRLLAAGKGGVSLAAILRFFRSSFSKASPNKPSSRPRRAATTLVSNPDL